MQYVKLLATFLFVGAPLLAPEEACAQTKMAVIDMQKAINETNEGAQANNNLKKLFDKRQVELNGREETLRKEKLQLEKRCRSTSQAQCQAGMEELQRKAIELQELMGQYQQDIQKRQVEATQPILSKMLTIVGRLARQGGYDLVIDKAAVHFQQPSMDLTEQAIRLYNSESNVPPPSPEPTKVDPKKKPGKKG
ncbi:MAG: OmpH family outer membrane protein [Myxococcales bacterium]|nr:OmpH family outer membrane protein [Polyangiaceae bacterium]MDW8251561.1 OmpH family outer membrane protein [Myxococcales bacterium]